MANGYCIYALLLLSHWGKSRRYRYFIYTSMERKSQGPELITAMTNQFSCQTQLWCQVCLWVFHLVSVCLFVSVCVWRFPIFRAKSLARNWGRIRIGLKPGMRLRIPGMRTCPCPSSFRLSADIYDTLPAATEVANKCNLNWGITLVNTIISTAFCVGCKSFLDQVEKMPRQRQF